MITETMSLSEIFHEAETDFQNAAAYLDHLNIHKYRKERLARPDGMLRFKPLEWTSPRKNKFYFVLFSPSKRDYKMRDGFCLTQYLVFYRKEGLYVMTQSVDYPYPDFRYHLYTPHFFQRYNERYLHKPLLSKLEVFKNFSREEGSTFSVSVNKSEKYGIEYLCAYKNGYSFAQPQEEGSKYFVHRTFLVGGNLYNNQNLDAFELECERLEDGGVMVDIGRDYGKHEKRKSEIKLDFTLYRVARKRVLTLGKYHQNLQEVSKQLYEDIKTVLELTGNKALKDFGQHLLSIASAKSDSEVEALVETEGKGYLE